jgi:hypothetical protein
MVHELSCAVQMAKGNLAVGCHRRVRLYVLRTVFDGWQSLLDALQEEE